MCRLSRSRLACEDAAEPAVCGVAGVAGTVAAAPSVSLRSFGGGDRISKSGNSRRSYNKFTQHNPIRSTIACTISDSLAKSPYRRLT